MLLEAVSPKLSGYVPKAPEGRQWIDAAGLLIPGPDASVVERREYLEWRERWAHVEVLGFAHSIRAILERSHVHGLVALTALGVTAAEAGRWTHLSISDAVTAAAEFAAAEDEIEDSGMWPTGGELPALRRALAAGAHAGSMWVGPSISADTRSVV
jgi:hypothetical protein